VSVRVAIDVTAAVTQRAGVGRYTRELVRALVDLPDGPQLCPFFVAPRADVPLDGGLAPVGLRRRIRSWRMEMLLRHLLKRPAHGPWDGAQLYHAPDVAYPPTQRIPVVTTVHDLSYVVLPQYHTRLNGTYLRLLTPLATRHARLVIADSQSTRRDLVERVGVPEQKVRVIYPGVAGPFTRQPAPERADEVRRRYHLTDAFLLSVGTLEPRKNLAGTLQAYRLLRRRLADAPPLVLVGASGWGLDEQRLMGLSEARYVRRLGYVPDEDLAALYASCSAFVYPSFYEGWGLPVAEAMALGAPTVTSNVSSLPEVAGDAALLVDPAIPEAIAAALERILVDQGTAARLRADGPARARQFTVQAWAAATMDVYREAVGDMAIGDRR
jgi:glycosyltransferase involved in cell wall biosynthesis